MGVDENDKCTVRLLLPLLIRRVLPEHRGRGRSRFLDALSSELKRLGHSIQPGDRLMSRRVLLPNLIHRLNHHLVHSDAT